MTEQATSQRDLTIKHTAEVFDCTPKHVYTLIAEGVLRSYKLGRATRICGDSIEHLRKTGFIRAVTA